MSSTFYGLNIGASALNAFSASVNTVANNLSNTKTEGYSRQVTNLEAGEALRNNNYGTLGTGVRAESITQMRNAFYDVKFWTNNSHAGQYEKKIYYMEQIQDLFSDLGKTKGFTTIYRSMFNSLESLKGNGADVTIRNQFINNTQSFMEYFNSMSFNLKQLQGDCNQEVRAMVSQINSYAQKISLLNEKINTIEVHGQNANELRDQRALLIDKLSALVPVEVEETEVINTNDPDMPTGLHNFRIKVEGQLLVDGKEYSELECYSRTEKINQNDIEGLFDIRWKDTGNDFIATSDSMSGQLKAVMLIRDGNNKENFKGVLESVKGNTITIKDPSITNVEAMNMPPRGTITVGNKQYTYSRFTMTVERDADGNEISCSYQFEIEDENVSSLMGKIGKDVNIGNEVDSRGIPYYLSQMNEFLRSFCSKINEIQQGGSINTKGNATGEDGTDTPPSTDDDDNIIDLMGTFIVAMKPNGKEDPFSDKIKEDGPGGSSTYTYDSDGSNYFLMTAETVKVNEKSLKDPNYFATSKQTDINESKAELVEEMLELQNNVVVYRGSGGDEFLQYITSDISVDTQEADILYANYIGVTETIDTYRMSVSSVDEDEEWLDLIKFQNAYNMASKIISTMNQMFDRLITQTGV